MVSGKMGLIVDCRLMLTFIVCITGSGSLVKGKGQAAFCSFSPSCDNIIPRYSRKFLPKGSTSARRKWFFPATANGEGLMQKEDTTNDNKEILFDEILFKEYDEAFREIIHTGRVMQKDSSEDVALAIEYLERNNPIVPIHASLTEHVQNLNTQHDDFLAQTNLTTSQYAFYVRTLTYLGDYCAKRRLTGPLKVAWHKLKESGTKPRENCISTYLYVLSLDESSDASAEVAAFHDMLYQPNEKTITLLVKSLVAKGDASAALDKLNSLPESDKSGEWKKLRTYVPILTLFCSRGEMASAMRLYQQMRTSPNVHFDPETYAILIGTLAQQGYFRHGASPIDDEEDHSIFTSSGPKLFDELATEMSDGILEINNATAKVLYDAFVEGFTDHAGAENLERLSLDDEIPICNNFAQVNEMVLNRVLVNEETAMCPRTAAKLRLFKLDEGQRKRVHDTLIEMAAIQYEEFMSKLEARFKKKMQEIETSDFAVKELTRFSNWLDEREGDPFTAIVDGANVAYYGSGNVNYRQVELVVEELEKMNENPVVTMPQKYVAEKFHTGIGFIQKLKEDELAIMNRLLDSGKMYIVPAKCLDDYYWMLASVSNQARSSNGVDIHVPPSNSEQRLPGLRPMLITCDQMRDHKLELIEPRLFRRWSSCHIVNYDITCSVDGITETCVAPEAVVDDVPVQDRNVEFFPADFFSREIQGNPIDGATVWHFPVSEWDEHDRFCIKIPS